MSSPGAPSRRTGSLAKFLKSTPAIVTAVLTVVAGVAGIISHTTNIVKVLHPEETSISQLVAVLKTEHLEVLPYRWRHLVGRADLPYLYWYCIEVQNRSKVRVNLKVNFAAKTREGEVIPSLHSPEYSVDAGKTLKEYPPPILDFGQHKVKPGDALVITWHILDERDSVIKQGTDQTELLPDNMLDWNLKAPNGDPIPQRLLLASLTAWTMPPKESLTKVLQQLQSGVAPPADPSSVARWFARCYGQFFNNPSGIHVRPAPIRFPGTGRQTIRTFLEILNDREANRLEAALFLGALSRATYGKRLRLVLFAVPEREDQPTRRTILFSWSTHPRSWHAVSLAEANSTSFESNEQTASKQVTQLLADHPEIIRALRDQGVFPGNGQQVVALDFVRADERFQFTAF